MIELRLVLTDLTNSSNLVNRDEDQIIPGEKSFTETIRGNVDTATTLKTGREIAGQLFDGSVDITVASTDLTDSSNLVNRDSNQTIVGKYIA